MTTATDLRAAIATTEKNIDWLLANDASYADITGQLALVARLRSQLMFVQRGTFAVGSRGAR